jgi:Gpi18-like mannosyltransferase
VVLEAIGILSLFYFPSARALFPIKDLIYHKPVSPAAEIWARWDSEWYLLLADRGYNSFDYFKDYGDGKYQPTDIAKFPLYPWAIRAVSILAQNSVYAGLTVSNIAAVIFLYFFYRLAEKLFGNESAIQGSLFYIFFPTSLFLNAIYTESLFLACVTAAFYYVEEQRLIPAALAAGLAVLCRATGLLAVPAILWLASLRFSGRKLQSILFIGVVCLLSLSVYLISIWKTFGSIAAVIAGPDHWRGENRYPLYALVRFWTNRIAIHGQHNSIIDFSFAILHFTALVFALRRIPMPYNLYSLLCLLMPLSSSLFSFSRLCLANFPFFLYLGSQVTGRWALVVQTLSAMLLAFFMAAFANWYWVG